MLADSAGIMVLSGQLSICHKEPNYFRILAIIALGINSGQHNEPHNSKQRSEKLLGDAIEIKAQ
jgi:hypothetical protein